MHTLTIYYRPDNYPYWVFWRKFDQKFFNVGKSSAINGGGVPMARANFFPRVSFGKPPDVADRVSTRRNLRRGFEFQIKLSGSGHMVIDRFRLHAQKEIEKSRGTQTP
jgi:hypothetical protein